MCDFCFNYDINTFEDNKSFENFDLQLDQKRNLKPNQNGLIVVDFNGSYSGCYFQVLKCNHCGGFWWFSTPDNAWRGFFMREENAKIKINGIRKDDHKKRLGCIVVMILIALMIVIYSLNN